MESRTRALCITFAILTLIGFVSLYVFWLLMRHSIEKIHTVNAAVEEQVMHQDENLALKNLLTDIDPDIQSLQSRIVNANDTVAFIDTFETLTRQSGATISVDSVSEKPAIEGKDYEYIELTMSTQGSWNQVHTLAAMLESLPFKSTIRSLSLSQATYDQSSAGTSTKQQLRIWKGVAIIDVLKKNNMKISNPLHTLRTIFRFKHKTAFSRNPNRDWKRIVCVSAILLLISFGLAVYLFLGVDRGTIFQPSALTENVTPTLDRASIDKLSAFYNNRAATIEKLKASSTPVVDPSL